MDRYKQLVLFGLLHFFNTAADDAVKLLHDRGKR